MFGMTSLEMMGKADIKIRSITSEMRRMMPNACGDWADKIDAALDGRTSTGSSDEQKRLALEAIKVVTATKMDAAKALSRIMAITNAAGVNEQYMELLANPDVALIVERPRREWAHLLKPVVKGCAIPPEGWRCTRAPEHSGPCAAVPL